MAPALIQFGSTSDEPVVYLDRLVTIIGSKPNCHVQLADPQVSGSHALFVTLGGKTYVRDLASRTGVFVRGRPAQEVVLADGDPVRIAEFEFEFRHVEPPGPDEAGPREAEIPVETAGAGQDPGSLELVVEGYDDAPPVPVEGPLFVIGRREGAELILEDSRISSAHAVIIRGGGRWLLYDLNSRYGTFVNGTRAGRAALSDGDLIGIGEFRLRCRLARGHPAAPAAGPAQEALPPRQSAPSSKAAAARRPGAAPAVPVAPPPHPSRAARARPASSRKKNPPATLLTPLHKEQPTAAAVPPDAPAPDAASKRVATPRRAGGGEQDVGNAVSETPAEQLPHSPAEAAPSPGGEALGAGHATPAPTATPGRVRGVEKPPADVATMEAAIPPAPTPAEPSAPSGPAAREWIQQCKRCGYYLRPTALHCPACGKWRRRAFAVLAGTLLVVALLGALAVWWLPQLKLTGPSLR